MQSGAFRTSRDDPDRARLARNLEEGRLYADLAACADGSDPDWLVTCLDRAIDALAAARMQLDATPEPRPWGDAAYRAFRSHHPETRIRARPADLAVVREAARRAR